MTKEELVKLGLTEELAAKVAAASVEEFKGYVSKDRFNEINEANKSLKTQLSDRDKQLDTLKKESGDAEALKAKIEELQTANKTAKAEYDSSLKEMQLSNAIRVAVAGTAQDTDIVAGLFDRGKLVLGSDGKVAGIDEQLKTIQESKPFLFKAAQKPGYDPAAGGGSGSKNPFVKETFNLTEQGKLLRENPAQAKAMAAAAGVTI